MKGTIKILIVCSGNSKQVAPFIVEQVESLKRIGIEFQYFLIKGKGILGYLRNLKTLKQTIESFRPDLIHAHYGLAGLLSVLQRRIKVVITFHGSDLNNLYVRFFSMLAYIFSSETIFVSPRIERFIKIKKGTVIPCGVDTKLFNDMNKRDSRLEVKLDLKDKLILFSSSFDNKVKNFPLAQDAINILEKNGLRVKLLEFKGYTRQKSSILMNSVDVALLTSFTEGSPQFIKEAMACNVPIVSTDVGDVRSLIRNVNGCYVASYDPMDVAENIMKALDFAEKCGKTNGRKKILELQLDIDSIALRIKQVYQNILM